MTPRRRHPGIDLYWLPLGADGNFVRLNERIHEAFKARRNQMPLSDPGHSARQAT